MNISILAPQPLELQQHLTSSSNKAVDSTSFADILQEQFQKVNQLEKGADGLTQDLLLGKVENLHEVTIAAEQANLALQLTVQVRNKLVEAYQELARMQI